MALYTVNDIITEVLVRNNRTTTDSFITDTYLQGWVKDAHVWASSFHKWPFTEGRLSTTFTSGGGPGADEWYFEGYKSDSERILTIGGKRFTKLNFEDYLLYREEEANGTDRVFSDFGRTLFINPYATGASGTLYTYGQIQPALDVTDYTATTIFSGWDEEGNEALVEKISGYIKRREHAVEESELHDQRATAKLEEIWKRVQDEQYRYQTHPDRGGMFPRFDVLRGLQQDEIWKRDQF